MSISNAIQRSAEQRGVRQRLLRTAGLPLVKYGPIFAAGPQNVTNPVVHQLLSGEKVLQIPDGHTRPTIVLNRTSIFSVSSDTFDTVIVQPTRSDGKIFIGERLSTVSGLVLLPARELSIAPRLANDFTYARTTSFVFRAYSSTRSTSNALLEGTFDMLVLFDYRDLVSTDRAAIMKAAGGPNAYVVGARADFGGALTFGPECIPREFNQPDSVAVRTDKGNDLTYDFLHYRTNLPITWTGGDSTIFTLNVMDGSLVPNLINAPMRIKAQLNTNVICTALCKIFCRSGRTGTEYSYWAYFPTSAGAVWPGTGGPYYGCVIDWEIDPFTMSKTAVASASPDDYVGLPYVIIRVEMHLGNFGTGTDAGSVHYFAGSVDVPGYFDQLNGPTGIALLAGFNGAQNVELQVKQTVEATPSGDLSQYMDSFNSEQRFADPSMLSLAAAAFNTGADGIRRAWPGLEYDAFKSELAGGKEIASVQHVVEASGPLSSLGGIIGGMIPGIGSIAGPILSGLGGVIDQSLFAAGVPHATMQVAGMPSNPRRIGYAAGPEDEDSMKANERVSSSDDDKEPLSPAPGRERKTENVESNTIGVDKAWPKHTRYHPYTKAVRQLSRKQIDGCLEDAGVEARHVRHGLVSAWFGLSAAIDSAGLPGPVGTVLKGSTALNLLSLARRVSKKDPIHTAADALSLLDDPAGRERVRTGEASGPNASPVGGTAYSLGQTTTPPNQLSPVEALNKQPTNTISNIRAIPAGIPDPADTEFARSAYFPFVFQSDLGMSGAVEPVFISSMAISNLDNSGNTVPATYTAVAFRWNNSSESESNVTVFVEDSLLPGPKGEADTLTQVGRCCALFGIKNGTYFCVPSMDRVSGPSIGLALAAAATGMPHTHAFTGMLNAPDYPNAPSIGAINYLPSKADACQTSGKLLVCPLQKEIIDLLGGVDNRLATSINDLLAGRSNPGAVLMGITDCGQLPLACSGLKALSTGPSSQTPEASEYQAEVANKVTNLRRILKEDPTAYKDIKEAVPTSNGEMLITVFDPDWWSDFSQYLGPEPPLINISMSKILGWIENGTFTKLVGLASQVVNRAAKNKRGANQPTSAKPRVMPGQQVTVRPSVLRPGRKGRKKGKTGQAEVQQPQKRRYEPSEEEEMEEEESFQPRPKTTSNIRRIAGQPVPTSSWKTDL